MSTKLLKDEKPNVKLRALTGICLVFPIKMLHYWFWARVADTEMRRNMLSSLPPPTICVGLLPPNKSNRFCTSDYIIMNGIIAICRGFEIAKKIAMKVLGETCGGCRGVWGFCEWPGIPSEPWSDWSRDSSLPGIMFVTFVHNHHYHNLWHHQMIRVDLPMPSSVESVSLLSAQKELSNTCKDWHYSDYHWDYCKDLYLWGFCKDCHCDIIGENIDRHLDTQQWHKTHWNWEEELIELKTDFQMFQRRKAINIIRSKMERRNEWGLVRKQDISSKQSSHYGCW